MYCALVIRILSSLTEDRFTDAVIKFAVSSDLPEKKDYSRKAHPDDGGSSQLDLLFYLILLLNQTKV